jgi:signal transduction histidine kinase
MKLAAKLVSLFVGLIVVVLAIDGYLSVQRETRVFRNDMKRDAHLLGSAFKDVIAATWRAEGQEHALTLIQEANKKTHPVHLRWVWLDAASNDPHEPRVPQGKLGDVKNGKEVFVEGKDDRGDKHLYTYIPVETGQARVGALELSEAFSELEQYTRATIVKVFVIVGVLILVSIPLVIILGMRMIGRPLHVLAEKTRRVGAGDLSGPIDLQGHNELTEVAEATNVMCEQLEAAWEKTRTETAAKIAALEQLRHEDRLVTIGRLASGIAHELGTPLNVISGRASLVVGGRLAPTEITESAGIIKAQSERITTTIRQLLDFARRRSPENASVDLQEVVRCTIDLLAPLARKQDSTLSVTGRNIPATVRGDAGQIQQVLTNLISNALQAMPQGGEVEVGLRREHAQPPEDHKRSEGEYFCMYVRDEGEGISEEHMPHLFEPFYTTKGIGEGTGLGLSIVYEIVREHDGWISVTSECGKGSCFSVYLPPELDQ